MNTIIVFQYDALGTIHYTTPETLLQNLDKSQKIIFETALIHSFAAIKEYFPAFHKSLIKRHIQIRITDDMTGTALLLPHDIILNAALLNVEKRCSIHRHRLLVGALERVFYHLCNPELHITQVRLHSLQFYQAHKKILKSTIHEMEAHPSEFNEPDWLNSLQQVNILLLLDRFWTALGHTTAAKTIVEAMRGTKSQIRPKIRNILADFADTIRKEFQIKDFKTVKILTNFKWLFTDNDCVVLVYKLQDNLVKVIRLCDRHQIDAMTSQAACRSVTHQNIRTDIFHDHGHWINDWVTKLQTYAKDSSLFTSEEMLLSDDLHKVKTAIGQLVKKIRRKENLRQSFRLLYSALYYWNNPDKGMCRSIALEVSAILEDVLTERPFTFPPSRINRSVFRPKPASIRITTQKPRNLRKDKFKARVLWSVNGRRKKPLMMTQGGIIAPGGFVTFAAAFPVRNGWIHYSVQVSFNEGKTWQSEELDDNSQGLLKYVADERGQRVLSFYADTFNLKLDESFEPVKDENGMFVYGTFDEIAEQLEGIREEGYTRIYPLGALELGWAGEAGPDPSVFSVWDGKTVRRDLGGLEALLRLREKADALGMKILLCVLSHFSRANTSYAYHMPVYIVNKDGKLTRRAGWDGEWSEWLDSFMVNMRNFENVETLAGIATELAGMGFGLRIDVGHGFDAVFPIDATLRGNTRLMGEVTTGGFEPIDLRGTDEPNIPLLYLCYKIQKAVPKAVVVYSEQWHGNETRMIKSGNIPYNSLIKNLENIRSGQSVHDALGLNDNLLYLNKIYHTHGGQTLSLFNSHDEESPTSNYQNMIWPVATFLVLSSQGPIMYHISRLPGSEVGSMQQRFDDAYTECWKHWVNNRFSHPWDKENRTRWQILADYPILYGFAKYLRALYRFVDENPAFTRGMIVPIPTQNTRIAAFLRIYKERLHLCIFNFPNSYIEGQQAVARKFNFLIGGSNTELPMNDIQPNRIYEVIERYNNAEGRTRRAKKEFWSGNELIHLGFGGVLAPVSSHVFEFIDKGNSSNHEQMLLDSFRRYPLYGKQDRVHYSYVAQVFFKIIDNTKEDFEAFAELFECLAKWIDKKHKSGLSCLSMLLAEISEDHLIRRHRITNFLMRIAVNEKKHFENSVCQSAVDILHGMNLGTIALVSPESLYSGAAGGVGIYTTDIADVLSELGFHVVVVTPLYESHREKIIKNFAPRYDGHCFTVQFPEFDDRTQSIRRNTIPDVINILRSNLLRFKHGKSARVEVLYLENGKYLDTPYGGLTGEDKIRRARILSQGALEALRAYNYYPSIIQTNEWPTWLVSAYLKRRTEYSTDPHFFNTRVGSMMHNPHPSYSIVMDEANMFKRYYYCMILGMDAVANADICINPDSYSGYEIDLTYLMLKTSDYIGTVSKAMRHRMLDEPGVFRHGVLYQQLHAEERFFSRRNGFNMAARQRFWFRSKKSILETYDPAARKRLFSKYTHAKKLAKRGLQSDPNTQLAFDDKKTKHVIFSMLHRICKQKGFELLVDWKVYEDEGGRRWVTYEPWKMMGPTVLEYFLSTDQRIQYVIAGRVEDSFDGRRFDMHFRRIASLPQFRGRFAYYPEGSLSPSLYRNLYVGSQFFIMPSGGEVGEPCGISQQEAHAGGTPVVAHHQDGLQRTVSDRDFGDKEFPSNGIKFSGFTGQSLLDALLDAVSIYYDNRRLKYFDKKGRPKKLRYRDLSYNAFNTDHRWLRLLHEYIQTYSMMAGIAFPDHIAAMRLIVSMADAPEAELANMILREGLTVPEAVNCLLDALSCPISSVRKAVENVLLRLYPILQNDILTAIDKHLSLSGADEAEKKMLHRLLEKITRLR
ncbi:MAG: glycogen/starch synthase [Phycisphaerae bacterium]|nr:glycogen/starch synthase [Phycisphaerae bacterium]